jgi:hypothetical protein
MDEWKADTLRTFIEQSYYSNVNGNGGEPEIVALSFVRFLRAAVEKDIHSAGDSKLLGTNGPRPKLAEEFFRQFLSHLATSDDLLEYTEDQWGEFLITDDRRFDESNWSLPFIGVASTTGTAYTPSAKASSVTFNHFFENPQHMGGAPPSRYLTGPGSILVDFAVSSGTGRFPRANFITEDLFASNGEHEYNIRDEDWDMVRFKSDLLRQVSVIEVEIFNINLDQWIRQERVATAITLDNEHNETKIRITTMCYSADSRRSDTVTIMH